MTDEELSAIEARCAAATPGPWEREHGIIWGFAGRVKVVYSGALTRDVGTLEFIAAAREDVPRLVTEVRELRGEVRELTEALLMHRGCSMFAFDDVKRQGDEGVLAKARQAGLL